MNIAVWLVLASVTATKMKRRPRSFDSFLEAEIIPSYEAQRGFYLGSRVVVRLLGVYLVCMYISFWANVKGGNSNGIGNWKWKWKHNG